MASQRPARTPQPGWQSPTNDMQRPTPQPTHSSGSVQFQPRERGDRAAPISSRYSQQQQPPTSPRDRNLPPTPQNMQDEEYAAGGGDSWGTRVGRKKSLVRPEREKLDPAHRLYHYRTHAAQLEDEGRGPVKPSSAYYYYLYFFYPLLTLFSNRSSSWSTSSRYFCSGPRRRCSFKPSQHTAEF